MNFSRLNTLHLFVSAFVAFTAVSGAQESGSMDPGVIKEVSPGIYQLGQLRIDKEKNTISFPGKINMSNGVLEYLLVGPQGSTHESLLVTDVPVSDVHTAMLLIGAKGAGLHAPSPEQQPPGQITDEYLKTAPELKGDRIFINVKWQGKEGEKEVPAEDLIVRSTTKKPAERGPWLYNGSMFGADGKFLAQQEQAFAALLTYPVALMNNPRKAQENDNLWEVNEKSVPPVETPVQISIRLDNPAVKPQ
jgi:hypothetical protein